MKDEALSPTKIVDLLVEMVPWFDEEDRQQLETMVESAFLRGQNDPGCGSPNSVGFEPLPPLDNDVDRAGAPAGQNARPPQLTIGSDVEIARHVIQDLNSRLGDIVFCDGKFWHYGGTHWRGIADHELRLAVQTYDGTTFRTLDNPISVVKLNEARVHSIIKQMEPMLARPDFFAGGPGGINCASGFVSFAPDGAPCLAPHDPEHRCRHVLKGSWDAGDLMWNLQLLFGARLGLLLDGVFRGDEDADQKVALLQEIAGAVAVGYGTKLRRPKAVILSGATAENGKSQVLDLLRGLLPPEAIASIAAAKMSDERYLPWLIGKHLNAADELSGASAIASDAFKAIVTGEPVTGRDVYRPAVTFRPVAQHVFCTNSLPSFAGGMDRGVQRRLLVIPFNRVIPKEERIERIGQIIGEEEADLLLAWAVEGASRLIRQRDFTIPLSSDEALKHWLSTADPVIAWAEEKVTTVDPVSPEWGETRMKSSEAHAHFKRFAVEEGFQKDRLPALNVFVQRLTAHLPTIKVKHKSKGNWLTGLKIEGYDPETMRNSFPPFLSE
jgi:putative DNA primase/helicase